MAKVIISVDTEAKTMKCSIDDKPLDGCESASAYLYNYEDESGDQCCSVSCSVVQYTESNGIRQVISNRVEGGGKTCGAEVAVAQESNGLIITTLPNYITTKAEIVSEHKPAHTLTDLLLRLAPKC